MDKPSLRKVLGVSDGVAILIGIMIGAGIYSTPQIIAGYLGSFGEVILLWLLGGAFVLISGLIYAELGSRITTTSRAASAPMPASSSGGRSCSSSGPVRPPAWP